MIGISVFHLPGFYSWKLNEIKSSTFAIAIEEQKYLRWKMRIDEYESLN